MDGEDFTFRYGTSEAELQVLCKADGTLINPEKVGCMTGTMVGMYATGNGKEVENEATFDWFEMKQKGKSGTGFSGFFAGKKATKPRP